VINLVGITKEQIHGTERSITELAYANYLQIEASRGDWFDLQRGHGCLCISYKSARIQGLTSCWLLLIRDGSK
jgi:thiaminase